MKGNIILKTEHFKIDDVSSILTSLPKINEGSTFWMIRANSGKYYSDFVMGQYVGIEYNEISLSDAHNLTIEQLKKLFKTKKPTDSEGHEIANGTYTSWAGQLYRFVNEVKSGDYVLVPSASSERFSLGIVVGEPYELTDSQINNINSEKIEGRERSPYKKRLNVQFLRSFNRSEADPKLYKMIYTQNTLSKINKYSPFILRACFDSYVMGNDVYITFPVTKIENIPAVPYTTFTYQLTKSYSEVNPNKNPVIKSNVQSQGIVQLILELSTGVGFFGFLWVMLRSEKGFTVDIEIFKCKFRFTKEDSGIVAQRIKNEETDRKIKEQEAQDEHVQKLVNLLNQSQQPMDEIEAEVSKELKDAVKKATTPIDDEEE